MNPCNEPHMSNAAWRAFVASHPHFHAPPVAPCGGSAVRHWLRKTAIGLGAGVGAVGVGAGIAPLVAAPFAAPQGAADRIGEALAASAGAAPVSVPEPSSFWLLAIAVAMLGVVALVARKAAPP